MLGSVRINVIFLALLVDGTDMLWSIGCLMKLFYYKSSDCLHVKDQLQVYMQLREYAMPLF